MDHLAIVVPAADMADKAGAHTIPLRAEWPMTAPTHPFGLAVAGADELGGGSLVGTAVVW